MEVRLYHAQMIKARRYEGNPILVPDSNHPWESRAVFNCAVCVKDNNIHMLYRAMDEGGTSRFGYAVSNDGYSFYRFDKPVVQPRMDVLEHSVEDPRMTVIGDKVYIQYCSHDRKVARVAQLETEDFISYKPLGDLFVRDENKNVALFPKKINGKYAWLHRTMALHKPHFAIWYCTSDLVNEILDSMEHKLVLAARAESWMSEKVGITGPPIQTSKGWLLFFHAKSAEDRHYRFGVCLLDQHEPYKVIWRQKEPVLEPEMEYEMEGWNGHCECSNCVFSCGIIEKDGEYLIYYGGADTTINVATIAKDAMMNELNIRSSS
jgi:beta-1,2-mannobiose phosphorylase / 1,2-beta-oligomannan phosphorylase